jgi:acyl-CoA thioesterase-1
MTNKVGAGALLVVLAAGVTWWLWPKSWPIVNAQPRGSAIIAFGDSLTAGTGAGDGNDYPTVLGRLLGVEVLNRGVPGDTTADAIKRLERDVLGEDPRIVIVCLGGNDGLQRLPMEATFENLRQIIQAIQREGALVVLVGVRSVSLADRYGGHFERLARDTGCVFVSDILAGILNDPSKKSDQIHPNDAGYRLMAERIAAAVRPFLIPD